MGHLSKAGSLVALVLVAFAVSSSAAARCPPGWGLKNFNILGILGGIISGNPNSAEPTCQPCGSWEASKGGIDARCELCTPGLSTPNAFKTACDCIPGTYMSTDPDGTVPTGVTKNCIRCGANSVSSTTNALSCTECPAGTAPGKNNKCNCPPGYRATEVTQEGAAGCIKCNEGLVGPGGLSTTCNTCPKGSVPLPSGDYCGCLAGSKLNQSEPFSCAPCATVFEYTTEPNRYMMCQQCYPFSYATADHTGCECTGGYYAVDPTVVPVRCRPCPAGTYKAGKGNDASLCIACPEGLEPSGSGRQCVKPACPAGTEPAPDGSCTPCSETQFNYMRNGTCQPCTNHTLANPERTKCDSCEPSYLQTSGPGEDLSCMSCMYGWKWNATTLACDVDNSAATEPVTPTVPDDAWKQFVPRGAQEVRRIPSNLNATRSGQTMGPGRFGADVQSSDSSS